MWCEVVGAARVARRSLRPSLSRGQRDTDMSCGIFHGRCSKSSSIDFSDCLDHIVANIDGGTLDEPAQRDLSWFGADVLRNPDDDIDGGPITIGFRIFCGYPLVQRLARSGAGIRGWPIRLPPASMKASRILKASCSGVLSPKYIIPRPSEEMSMPVLSSLRYFIT